MEDFRCQHEHSNILHDGLRRSAMACHLDWRLEMAFHCHFHPSGVCHFHTLDCARKCQVGLINKSTLAFVFFNNGWERYQERTTDSYTVLKGVVVHDGQQNKGTPPGWRVNKIYWSPTHTLPWYKYITIICPLESIIIIFQFCRWLVSQGRMERALKIMRKFEKINGKTVDPTVYTDYSVSSLLDCNRDPICFRTLKYPLLFQASV